MLQALFKKLSRSLTIAHLSQPLGEKLLFEVHMSSQTIQSDWENRELTEIVQLNILQITSFLNKFDLSTRSKLAKINEKLNSLERTLDFAETAVRNTGGKDGGGGEEK